MTARLDPAEHSWVGDARVQAVFDALEAAISVRPVARFVGGCVRNAIRGAPVDDVDLATILPPQDVAAALKAAGLRAAPTGIEHGTVTAVVDGEPFEITTLRRDVSTDGRNATVAFSENWREDSERRDFRLNAIYADRDGTLFDPQGGVPDALAGRIRFIGEAESRIREDYLRILRFFRFLAWYGAGEVDEAGMAACAALAPGMARLSAERVWKEFKKLLRAGDPSVSVRAMADTGVLAVVLPEGVGRPVGDAFAALCRRAQDPLTRLGALTPRDATVVEALVGRLKMSNAEGARLRAWANDVSDLAALADASPGEHARRLYAADPQAVSERALQAAASAEADGDAARAQSFAALADFIASWRRPVFPLAGRDLIDAGVPPGPDVGALLRTLEAGWADRGFQDGREALLAELRRLRETQGPS